MPAALAARGAEIGDGFTERMLVTVGEACLKPAILLAIGGPGHDELRKATSPRVMDAPARTMLTPGINSAFRKNLERQHNSGAQRIATGGEPQGKWDGQSVLFEVDGARMLEDPLLSEEVFGPTALLVRVKDVEQLIAIARQFRGQLSATMQIDPADHALAARLVPILERRTGRIVINAFSHPREGVVRIDSWRTVPRNLRQSLHFSRHDGNRAISAASLLPGFPGRFVTGSVEALQSVRHLASHRW